MKYNNYRLFIILPVDVYDTARPKCDCMGSIIYINFLTVADFANSVHLDEVAHNEPPHQGLHCLPSSH